MNNLKVKMIVDEDFINFKQPSMYIATCLCDFKCCREQGLDISICQNSEIVNQPTIEISNETIYERFISNDISKAVVIGGLEPMKQFDEVISLIKYFRDRSCYCPFVIYTGYEPNEIERQVRQITITGRNNIYFKFGRFVPNQQPHYDEVLGIKLISDNQRGVRMC